MTKLTGKTKEDLTKIAHISGLLTQRETSRMSKSQLLAFLQQIESEAEHKEEIIEGALAEPVSAADTALEKEDEGVKKRRGRPKKVAAADRPRATEIQETEEKPQKRRGRPKKSEVLKEEQIPLTTEKSEGENKEAEVKEVETNSTKTKKRQPRSKTKKTRDNVDKNIEQADFSETLEDIDLESEEQLNVDEKPKRAKKTEKTEKTEATEMVTGILDIMADNYGFLRVDNYLQSNKDVYVPPQYIRRFNLNSGDKITGPVKKQRDNDRYKALYYIKEVNGMSPDKMTKRKSFDRLTPIYPEERFCLETSKMELSTRIIDLIAPIGKGQRGMIVSPPKAGKTILLQKVAKAISENNPEAKLIVLLIDERPEEVTDMQRYINGEVVYSTFDKSPENHVKITELVLERAKRLVEMGQDVVILLDSITRMARAYNLTINPTGRTLSGGLDPGALYGPKRFFGAARNIENGGSLTIIATSLIETGSRMDEVIFEEFKGTGNMEVYLDRKLSEKRIFPAIDINRSGTRREELLLSRKELDSVWAIRKAFGQLDTTAVTETIINLMIKTKDNDQFISSINVSFNDKNLFEAMRGSPKTNNNQNGNNGNNGNNGYTN